MPLTEKCDFQTIYEKFSMKKNAKDYLFNEAVKYLGKYPATCKKIKEYLQKKNYK